MKKVLINLKKPEIIGFLLLLIIAVFLRFYQLGNLPPGIMVDETAVGYNAYSIYKTGRDEWGVKLPLIFKSFGDYKPPGLEYTIAFLLNFFPLSTFLTRLPSAIGGLLMSLALFFLARKMYPRNKLFPLIVFSLASFSPWPFRLSRFYFEANAALGFFTVGFSLLAFNLLPPLPNQKQKPKKIFTKSSFLGMIFLAISAYYYMAHRILAIGVAIIFVGVKALSYYWQNQSVKFVFRKMKKGFILLFIFFLLISPMLIQLFSPQGRQRLIQENQLARFGGELVVNDARKSCYLALNKNEKLAKICYVFWNKPVVKIENILISYLKHFSFYFHFIEGDKLLAVSPSLGGNFSIFLVPFFILGFFFLTKKATQKKSFYLFLLLSFLIAPIPASLVGEPLIQRSSPMIPFILLIFILGFQALLEKISNKKFKTVILLSFSAIWLFSTTKYMLHYFLNYTQSNDFLWRAQLPETIDVLNRMESENQYSKVIINDLYGEDFLLALSFYNQIDPQEYQENVKWSKINEAGWLYPRRFKHYEVGSSYLDKLVYDYDKTKNENILYITCSNEKYSTYADKIIYDRYHIHKLVEFYNINNLMKKIPKKYLIDIQ